MTTTISFRGVEIALPLGLPFSYTAAGALIIDFSAGYYGKLTLRPGEDKEAASELFPRSQADGEAPGTDMLQAKLQNDDTEPPAQALAQHGASPCKGDMVIPDSQAARSLPCLSWFNRSPEHIPTQSPCRPATRGSSDLGLSQAAQSSMPKEETIDAEPRADEPEQQNVELPADPVSERNATPAEDALKPTSDLEKAALAVSHSAQKIEETFVAENLEKENTPAAANRPSKAKGKRKSDTAAGQPSTGKRSGKKKKPSPTQAATELSFTWRQLDCKGGDGLPQERWGGTLTALSTNQVCLFAGNSTDEQLGDTWLLDMTQPAWRRAPVVDAPGKAWHAAAEVTTEEGRGVYAIGGERVPTEKGEEEDEDDDGGECLAEVCLLDMDAGMWITLPMSGEPPQRSGHSCTPLPDGRLLLFGGIDNDGRYRNDAHIIDPRRLDCFPLTGSIVRGAPPKPRAYHSATLVGNSIVVLGGTGARPWSLREVYSLSVETWQWREHTSSVEGEPPAPRSGHAAVALPDQRHLLVFGGGLPESDAFFAGVSILDTHTWTWTSPQLQGACHPCARSGHAAALVALPGGGHALAVHGGRTHGETLCDDTWLLEIGRQEQLQALDAP